MNPLFIAFQSMPVEVPNPDPIEFWCPCLSACRCSLARRSVPISVSALPPQFPLALCSADLPDSIPYRERLYLPRHSRWTEPHLSLARAFDHACDASDQVVLQPR